MLAVGLAGGVAMWRILTAGDAPAGSADASMSADQTHARVSHAGRTGDGDR